MVIVNITSLMTNPPGALPAEKELPVERSVWAAKYSMTGAGASVSGRVPFS